MPLKKTKKQCVVPGSSKSITIHLKSPRNPAFEFTIPNASVTTTNSEDLKRDVRGRIADAQGNEIPLEKVKLLYKRKPVTGNKSIAEILADEPDMLSGGKEVEFGIMVIGGAGAKVVDVASEKDGSESQQKQNVGAEGKSGESEVGGVSSSAYQVLESEAFWEDLQGFLIQKTHDENVGKQLRSLFASAWARR